MNGSWLACGGLLWLVAISLADGKAANGQAFCDHRWRCVRLEIYPICEEAGGPEGDCRWRQVTNTTSVIEEANDDLSYYVTGYDATYDSAVYGVNTNRKIADRNPVPCTSHETVASPAVSTTTSCSEHAAETHGQPIDPMQVTFLPFDGEPESLAEYVYVYGPSEGCTEVPNVPYRVYTATTSLVEGEAAWGITHSASSSTLGGPGEERDAVGAHALTSPSGQPTSCPGESVFGNVPPDGGQLAGQYVSAERGRDRGAGRDPLLRLWTLARQGWFDVRCRLTAKWHEVSLLLTEAGADWADVKAEISHLGLVARPAQQPAVSTVGERSSSPPSTGEPEQAGTHAPDSSEGLIVEWYPWPDESEPNAPQVGLSHPLRSFQRYLRQWARGTTVHVQHGMPNVGDSLLNTIRSTPGCQAMVTWLARSLGHSGRVLQNASVQLDLWIHSAAPTLPREGGFGSF